MDWFYDFKDWLLDKGYRWVTAVFVVGVIVGLILLR